MPVDLLDTKTLVSELSGGGGISISRAGRNCAVGMTRKAQNEQPHSARASMSRTESQEVATTAMGSLTARGAAEARKAKAAVKALSITSAVSDHKLAFGRGIREDDGGRRELCSSPRPHPEFDAFMLAEFQAGRRGVFDGIQSAIPQLELVDAEAVEEEIEARKQLGLLPRLAPSKATPALASLAPGGDALSEQGTLTLGRAAASPGAAGISRSGTPQAGAMTPRAVTPSRTPQALRSPAHAPAAPTPRHAAGGVDGTPAKSPSKAGRSPQKQSGKPAALSPRAIATPGSPPQKLPGGASPRPKRALASAAFTAPGRFLESARPVILPSVGHYRPKYGAVEHRATQGKIMPPGAMSSRKPKDVDEREPSPRISDVLKQAREEVRPRALKEREERRRARAAAIAAGDDDDDVGGAARKKAGRPEPSKDSSPAFKSRVAGTATASARTAAPDVVYWPLAENGTHKSPRANVDFAKQTPRPPLAENAVLPDPRSTLSAFSPEVAKRAPDMGKYSARKGMDPRRPLPDAPLDIDRANTQRFERPRVCDFTSGSPRKGAFDSPRESYRLGVSVEEAPTEKLQDPSRRVPHPPSFDKMQSRPEPRPTMDLPPLQVAYEATDHRVRAAVMRPDPRGREGAFATKSSVAEGPGAGVGAYNPDVSPIRPKTLRNVDFSKGTVRQEARANIADLQYDYAVPSPRVQGNPMMGQQVSRAKREEVLGARSAAADVSYDVKLPRGGGAGMLEMERQVDRFSHAAGRAQPAERTVVRLRKEQEAAAEAGMMKLAEKEASRGRSVSPRR